MKKNIIIGASSSIGQSLIQKCFHNSIFTYNSNSIINGVKFNIQKQQINDIVDLSSINNAIIMSAITKRY